MPAVSNTHADNTLFVAALFRFVADLRRAGAVRTEPYNMKLEPNLPGRSPDVLVVTSEHFDRLHEDHLQGAADLVVEVVSPGYRDVDRSEKFKEYERGGVREYWIIDPERKMLELFVLNMAGKFEAVPPQNDGTYASSILPDVRIKPEWLWGRPLPLVPDVLREWGLLK